MEIYFETDLCCCMGDNVGGRATIKLNEEEEKMFVEALEPAEESGDMLAYFEKHLPEETASKIERGIIRGRLAIDIANYGQDLVGDAVSDDEWDEMSLDEKIDLVADVDPGCCDCDDCNIVEITVLTQA